MKFCPKCKSLMQPKTEKGKVIWNCLSCGHSDKKSEDVKLKEEIKHKLDDVEVIEKDTSTLPLVDEPCPECSHKRAFFWMQQTRAGDEPETKFYKCEKCSYTWRDYN